MMQIHNLLALNQRPFATVDDRKLSACWKLSVAVVSAVQHIANHWFYIMV